MKIKRTIVVLTVLICVVFLACFLWFLLDRANNPKDINPIKLESDYIAVCESNGFTIYSQKVTESSTSGVVKGYMSTIPSGGAQFDYYEFENEEYAEKAFKRIVGWVMVNYGERSYSGETIEGPEWVLDSDSVYFRAVLSGNSLTYMLCTELDHIEYAANMLEEVTGA